ncbi:hypothetical protein, partial [Klebsiella michiganensis]
LSRRYRIALNRDILNQHFTSSSNNEREIIMFFNNIKMCARIDPQAAQRNRNGAGGKEYFRRKRKIMQVKEKEI